MRGPPALERLDAVEIEIRDDGYTHGSGLAGGPSQQDIDETIWGPYRFKPGIDGASTNGRKVPAAAMELGEWRKLALEQSFAAARTDGTYWRNRYAGAPVRLSVRCRREGRQPWVLTYNVDVANPQ
ncbi:hypothetical protein [Streptomyces blattellae]|uniref:hypothetical protein n=1 Tax=Streptomyces blattellae TaxID=2569855 RepID=UPI0012B7CAAA|nr:hypothetical protein [Streptomyces blattellae]